MGRTLRSQVRSLISVSIVSYLLLLSCLADIPSPKPWPAQFHSQLYQTNKQGAQSVVDLWYDWPNGRNYNIIQHQLSYKLYDVEWSNGTSYFFDVDAKTCFSIIFEVGILRPDWLDHSTYVGVEEMDGFTCNVWEKSEFITYYEDTETQRPVAWLFYTGQFVHVMSFEEGAVLGEEDWQAPSYCFTSSTSRKEISSPTHFSLLRPRAGTVAGNEPWKGWLAAVSRHVQLRSW